MSLVKKKKKEKNPLGHLSLSLKSAILLFTSPILYLGDFIAAQSCPGGSVCNGMTTGAGFRVS